MFVRTFLFWIIKRKGNYQRGKNMRFAGCVAEGKGTQFIH